MQSGTSLEPTTLNGSSKCLIGLGSRECRGQVINLDSLLCSSSSSRTAFAALYCPARIQEFATKRKIYVCIHQSLIIYLLIYFENQSNMCTRYMLKFVTKTHSLKFGGRSTQRHLVSWIILIYLNLVFIHQVKCFS